MFRTILFSTAGVAALSVALVGPAPRVAAQEQVLSEMYGSGVHSYYSGDYRAAFNDLSAAIDGGTPDPRAYYFRALAYLRLGREEEAVEDMKAGASLEIADGGQAFPVSRSLERIQGRDRMLLERYRSRARLAAFERLEAQRVERYGRPGVANPVSPNTVRPVAPPVAPPTDLNPLSEPAGVDDPFTDDEPTSTPTPPPTPDVPPVSTEITRPAGEMPADADAQPVDDADPFGAGATTPPAAEEPADAADPFATPDDAADPFGGSDDAADDETMPADDADAADPFGIPGDAAGDEAMPADDATDLFGGSDAAAPDADAADADAAGEAAADDPFGSTDADADAMDDEEPAADADATETEESDPFGADPFGGDAAADDAAADDADMEEPAADDEASADDSAATAPSGAVGSFFRAITAGPRNAAQAAANAASGVTIPGNPLSGGAPAGPGVPSGAGPTAGPVPLESDFNTDPFADDPDQPAAEFGSNE